MGIAYRCWDTKDNRPVVVKMPQERFRENKEFTERFAREIRTTAALIHPHIIPILDDADDLGCPYVVMRFLPGGSLSDRLPRDKEGSPSPVNPAFLHLWLPRIAAALDYAHGKGVVHRDVKPDNIFFDGYWNAFLGDFGIAKVFQESDVLFKDETLTATNAAIGTQTYMAPEMFTNKSSVDGRADQYALGVMAYEQLCGERPFAGARAHIAIEHCTMKPAPLGSRRPHLPRHVCEAVHRALRKRPEDRFATCSDFAAALLKNVPAQKDDEGIARLLCPGCRRILKLREAARGKVGACPRCKQAIHVAADLGSLWLTSEENSPVAAAVRVAPPKFDTVRSATHTLPRWRWGLGASVALAVAVICASTALFVRWGGVRSEDVGRPVSQEQDVAPQSLVVTEEPMAAGGPAGPGGPPAARTLVPVPATLIAESVNAAGHVIKDLLTAGAGPAQSLAVPATVSSGIFPWEMRNRGAFAALKRHGEVVTWGDAESGGDSAHVRRFLLFGVSRVFSNDRAFAALKDDGSVIAWGHMRHGGAPESHQPVVRSGVSRVISTCTAFAAIKADGAVEAWGTQQWWDGKSMERRSRLFPASTTPRGSVSQKQWSDEEHYSTRASKGREPRFLPSWTDETGNHDQFGDRVFAARYFFPLDPSSCSALLRADAIARVTHAEHPLLATRVLATTGALASLSDAGRVDAWGHKDAGGDARQFAGLLAADVVRVSATRSAFAVLRTNGSVLAFGNGGDGGDPVSVAARLEADVIDVKSTSAAFVALKADGSVVTWGDSRRGGDSSGLPSTVTPAGRLTQGIRVICATSEAFAGITVDGAAVAWGAPNAGGEIGSAGARLGEGVVAIAATARAFAALKEDGSVVSWGDPSAGGDATGVAEKLRSGVVFIASTAAAFAALKSDGSVVTWGDPKAGGDTTPVADRLAEDVVSIASPFMDEHVVDQPDWVLHVIRNGAPEADGAWQYSRGGNTWVNIPADVGKTAPLVLDPSCRLRYLPLRPGIAGRHYLSAVVVERDDEIRPHRAGALGRGVLRVAPYSFGMLALVPQSMHEERSDDE